PRGQPRAGQRRGLGPRQVLGHGDRRGLLQEYELGQPAVDGAAELVHDLGPQRAAGPTRPVRGGDAVAFAEAADVRTDRDHLPGAERPEAATVPRACPLTPWTPGTRPASAAGWSGGPAFRA